MRMRAREGQCCCRWPAAVNAVVHAAAAAVQAAVQRLCVFQHASRTPAAPLHATHAEARKRSGLPCDFDVLFYDGKYFPSFGSIFPLQDVVEAIPQHLVRRRGVAVLARVPVLAVLPVLPVLPVLAGWQLLSREAA